MRFVPSSNQLSHRALADLLMREHAERPEFYCRHCKNQARCFIDMVRHFSEHESDLPLAPERLDMARAAYEFYNEQLNSLDKIDWDLTRSTCGKCGLQMRLS